MSEKSVGVVLLSASKIARSGFVKTRRFPASRSLSSSSCSASRCALYVSAAFFQRSSLRTMSEIDRGACVSSPCCGSFIVVLTREWVSFGMCGEALSFGVRMIELVAGTAPRARGVGRSPVPCAVTPATSKLRSHGWGDHASPSLGLKYSSLLVPVLLVGRREMFFKRARCSEKDRPRTRHSPSRHSIVATMTDLSSPSSMSVESVKPA